MSNAKNDTLMNTTASTSTANTMSNNTKTDTAMNTNAVTNIFAEHLSKTAKPLTDKQFDLIAFAIKFNIMNELATTDDDNHLVINVSAAISATAVARNLGGSLTSLRKKLIDDEIVTIIGERSKWNLLISNDFTDAALDFAKDRAVEYELKPEKPAKPAKKAKTAETETVEPTEDAGSEPAPLAEPVDAEVVTEDEPEF